MLSRETLTLLAWLGATFTLGVIATLLITPLVIRSAAALSLFDSPDEDRRVHADPVPRLGGVSVYLGGAMVATLIFIAAQDLFLPATILRDPEISFLAGVFIGSAFLFLVGLVDDTRGLSPSIKLAAQVIAALVVFYFGARVDSITLGYGDGARIGVLAFPLLLFWIVGVTNSFNFIDGLNGLAGGIAIVAMAATVIVGAATGNVWVLVPAFAFGGALLGFLHFNFPRARIFLGDSGSLSIGFLLATLTLRAATTRAGSVLVIVPLLAVFVPLLDGALAIARRWLRHVPLAGADARHIHHRLLALGLSPARTAVMLWALATAMAGFGLLIALTPPFVATSIAMLGLVGVAVILIYATNLLSYHELLVAGEVLVSAPSRARRIISDQILALDLTTLLDGARSVEEVASLLSDSAGQFGFLAMDLSGGTLVRRDLMQERIVVQHWAWRLDYPIRLTPEGAGDVDATPYVLSIWCSQENHARPYGAERIARILGPAIQRWFAELSGEHRVPVRTRTPWKQRRIESGGDLRI
jgi:UDP-GlcNAc:undecaprenyl-phosphate GlcNAc-1-phosphate transferase